jgi:hypothetical protein
MKVLYLSADPGIDLAGQSGGSIHIRSFVRALADLGHQVTVVCSAGTHKRGRKSSHLGEEPALLTSAHSQATASMSPIKSTQLCARGRMPFLLLVRQQLTGIA